MGEINKFQGDIYIDDKYVQPKPYPEYTTIERDALTDVIKGYIIWNTTTNAFNKFDSSSWQEYSTIEDTNLKVNISDIINTLVSTDIDKPLSAYQGKILYDLIQSLQGSLIPQGNWDADTNTPDITGTTTIGHYWLVNGAGTTSLDGITDWEINDWAIKTETGWAKIDNSLQGYFDIDTSTEYPHQEGRIKWCTTTGKPIVDLDGISAQLAENVFKVKNTSGGTITKLAVVRPTGATDNNPTVDLADATHIDNSRPVGIIISDSINNNETGYVCLAGKRHGLDTSSFSEGDKLYLSTTPGELTTTKPVYPNYVVRVGVVLRSHATEGIIVIDSNPENDVHNIPANAIKLTDTASYYIEDNVEDALVELGDTKFTNGFDLQTPNSLGDISIATRTISIAVKSGQPNFYFWANGKKIIKTTTQSVTIPDTTGAYYIYFDNSGVLQQVAEDSMSVETIYQYALVALVYWNATQGESRVGNEQHGIRMSASTHAYNHLTYGARYDGNDGLMDIEGLTNNDYTYSQITSGHFWDEDIRHHVYTENTHPYLYRLGASGEWTTVSADNRLAIKNDSGDTYYAWNEWTGSTWKLTQGTTSTDYWILFFVAMPSISGNNIVKLLGQNAYASRYNARNAIEKEIDNIVTDGLPNPEFIFLYAVIVNRNGKLQKLADGSLFYDLRKIKGASGGASSSTSYASDIPTDTTNFDGALSSDDDNVQKALETLDDVVDDKANKNNVLELDNTTSFTPDSDYEPATKKYVDDNVSTSGTWTATTTYSTNCSSSSVVVARYSRQGDIVTFDIKGTYDPNSSSTTRFYVSLPIASNFSSVNDAIGVVTGVNESGVIEASTTFNSLYIIMTGNNTASHTFNAHGSYKII